MKPPISKAKMTAITRNAIKAIKLYKHVVQCVEKFIQKVNNKLGIQSINKLIKVISIIFLYNLSVRMSCIVCVYNYVLIRHRSKTTTIASTITWRSETGIRPTVL